MPYGVGVIDKLMKVFKLSLAVVFIIAYFFVIRSILANEKIIIEMTEDGFKPNEISIGAGSSIEFKNIDLSDRWPASNIHPTHEIYPEFDPQRPIQPGNSWVVIFNKVGSWKYHDHINPHLRGQIIVSENSNLFSSLKDWFIRFIEKVKKSLEAQNNSSNLKAIETSFKDLPADKQFVKLEEISRTLGSQKGWEKVLENYKSEGGLSGAIHDLAHLAGTLIYKEQGMIGLGICTPEFAFGCFHGFLDEAFSKNISKLKEAEKGCEVLGRSGPYASCIHGIGHGVASFYQTSDLDESLEACKILEEVGRQYCYDGVFMEFTRNSSSNFYKNDDPLFPCNILDSEFVFACGRNQPNVMMTRLNIKFEDVSNICLGSENQDFKLACFDSLGFIAAQGNPDSKSIILSCSLIKDEQFMSRCAQAAAGELIFQNVPRWQEESYMVCENLEEEYAKQCRKYLDSIKRDYNRS